MTHILIVDDNENNRLSLQLLLEELQDIRISEAQNGEEAVAFCKHTPVDLIFMDIMMPIMDGIEATAAIKAFAPKTMIIALSALEDGESQHRMFVAGAEDYLTKPIQPELFLQRIRNYLNIIHLRSQPKNNPAAANPFSINTYHRKTVFSVLNEEVLAEFWDYALSGPCLGQSDVVRVSYGIGLWLLKIRRPFSIVIEESEEAFYLSLQGAGAIKKKILSNILKRHLPATWHSIDVASLHFCLPKETQEKEVLCVAQEAKEILSKTHEGNLGAREYVEQTAVSILPKIEALELLEDRLDAMVIAFEKTPDKTHLDALCEAFWAYHEVLELLSDFGHLAFAIQSLTSFLQGLESEHLASEKIHQLATLLLHLLHDLASWRDQIFVSQEAINIHYLDASLLSSCMQIEALLSEKTIDEGDDLEFF